MSIMVKICGLHDAAAVAAAVESGARAIGFVFTESVRRVTTRQANDASREIGADVQRVAVMRHPTNDEWRAVLDEFAPDVLQTDIEDFDALDVPDSVIRWPVLREGSAALENELPGVFVYEGAALGHSVGDMYRRRWYPRSNVWRQASTSTFTTRAFRTITGANCESGLAARPR